jgi:hypothetical protein
MNSLNGIKKITVILGISGIINGCGSIPKEATSSLASGLTTRAPAVIVWNSDISESSNKDKEFQKNSKKACRHLINNHLQKNDIISFQAFAYGVAGAGEQTFANEIDSAGICNAASKEVKKIQKKGFISKQPGTYLIKALESSERILDRFSTQQPSSKYAQQHSLRKVVIVMLQADDTNDPTNLSKKTGKVINRLLDKQATVLILTEDNTLDSRLYYFVNNNNFKTCLVSNYASCLDQTLK